MIPVQAKGGRDQLGIVQVEQDIALCASAQKIKNLECLPVAAQFMEDDVIALFLMQQDSSDNVRIQHEKHYRLTPSSEMSAEEIRQYRKQRPRGE